MSMVQSDRNAHTKRTFYSKCMEILRKSWTNPFGKMELCDEKNDGGLIWMPAFELHFILTCIVMERCCSKFSLSLMRSVEFSVYVPQYDTSSGQNASATVLTPLPPRPLSSVHFQTPEWKKDSEMCARIVKSSCRNFHFRQMAGSSF